MSALVEEKAKQLQSTINKEMRFVLIFSFGEKKQNKKEELLIP